MKISLDTLKAFMEFWLFYYYCHSHFSKSVCQSFVYLRVTEVINVSLAVSRIVQRPMPQPWDVFTISFSFCMPSTVSQRELPVSLMSLGLILMGFCETLSPSKKVFTSRWEEWLLEIRNQTQQTQVCICFGNSYNLFICLTYSHVFPGKCKMVLYEPQSARQKIALKWAMINRRLKEVSCSDHCM